MLLQPTTSHVLQLLQQAKLQIKK